MDKESKIFSIAIILIFVLGIIGCYFQVKHQESKWNNGIHAECGGKWEFQNVARGKSETTYYYICDECGELFSSTRYYKSLKEETKN